MSLEARRGEPLPLVASEAGGVSTSPAQARLRDRFAAIRALTGYEGFFIIGPDNINLASSRDINVGLTSLLTAQEEFVTALWSGNAAMGVPLVSDVPLQDSDEELRERYGAAPIEIQQTRSRTPEPTRE